MGRIQVWVGRFFGVRRVWLYALCALAFSGPLSAQIAFRSASSSTAGAPLFRSASSATLPTPTFRAAASSFTVGAAITINKPAGTATDDVMIASIGIRPTTATITPPAGWVLIRRLDNASLNANSLVVYRKVAGAAEPASYTFTVGGSTHTTGGIQSFFNVDTINPIDVESGANTASGTTHATPTVTTTVPNSMVVTSHSFASASTFTPPAGMTESFDVASGPDNAVGQTTEGNRVLQAARGATGVKTASAATQSDVGNGHILALKPSLPIPQPAGLAANDVMIASIGVTPSTAVVSAPPGWSLVRRIDNASATSNSLHVFQKAATGAEPADYEFSVSGVDFAVGGIQAFYNVDTVSPIDVDAGQTTVSATTHTAPTITTTVPNAMLVTSHTYAASRTWTPPGGMTEGFDQPNGANSATGQSVEGNYQALGTAGATGVRTATAAGNADRGNAHALALRAARPVLTITVPAGTAANDVMVASVSVQPSTATVTTPAGWTLVRQINNGTATTNSLYVYQRVAGASEPASYTWNMTNLSFAAGGIQSFSGVDTAAPIDVENGAATASALTHATPSVTTTVANAMLVTSHGFAASATWTPPAGMTEGFETAALTSPNALGQSIQGNYVLQAGAGATGVKTATASANADRGAAHILALKPNPAAFTPGNFNAYDTGSAAGAIAGFIKTKISGSTVTVDVVALNGAKTAILTTFTGAVKVEILDASNNTGAVDANGCRPTWSVLQTLANPTFAAGDNGRKSVSFTEANAYRDIRVRISYPAASPTVVGCSTDNFAIRPNTFANFAVTDATWQTAGTGRALTDVAFGATMHKAGRPLSVRATAVNAAGTPATTTNYTGSPTPTFSACGGAACTSSFGNFTVGAAFALGQLTSDVATYDNVGSFQLQLVDTTFAAVDAGDGSTNAERYVQSAAINVGRFVPDHFAVSMNTPMFGNACGAFTYVGQPFNYTTAPVITVTAQNFANNATTLYTGSWWRITGTSLTGKSYAAATGSLTTTGLPGTDPVISATGSGQGTLTFGSGSGLLFTRGAPVAPFNADISLSINVIDADGVAYASNPASFGTATSGNGIAFSSSKTMRFGRLRLTNANGSQLISMPIRMETQYWNGTAFTTAADTCTTIAASNVSLGNYLKNLGAGQTVLTSISAFSGGVAWLRLSAPGASRNGSVDVSLNLSGAAAGASCTPGMAASTASSQQHLQGAWCGGAFSNDPTARATFGTYRASESFIYIRELF